MLIQKTNDIRLLNLNRLDLQYWLSDQIDLLVHTSTSLFIRKYILLCERIANTQRINYFLGNMEDSVEQKHR